MHFLQVNDVFLLHSSILQLWAFGRYMRIGHWSNMSKCFWSKMFLALTFLWFGEVFSVLDSSEALMHLLLHASKESITNRGNYANLQVNDFNVARVYIFLLVNYFTRFGKQKNMSKKSLCIPFWIIFQLHNYKSTFITCWMSFTSSGRSFVSYSPLRVSS